MVNLHKQRAITTESMVEYGPLSNLDIMVLNNVTKFHKIYSLESGRRLYRRTYGQTYIRTYGQGLHLKPRPLSWRGHKNSEGCRHVASMSINSFQKLLENVIWLLQWPNFDRFWSPSKPREAAIQVCSQKQGCFHVPPGTERLFLPVL